MNAFLVNDHNGQIEEQVLGVLVDVEELRRDVCTMCGGDCTRDGVRPGVIPQPQPPCAMCYGSGRIGPKVGVRTIRGPRIVSCGPPAFRGDLSINVVEDGHLTRTSAWVIDREQMMELFDMGLTGTILDTPPGAPVRVRVLSLLSGKPL